MTYELSDTRMKTRKVIYTIIIGKGYTLRDPAVKTDGWDHICFTDQPLTSSVWEIERVKVPKHLTNRKFVKHLKILGEKHLPGYGVSFYLPSKYVLRVNLNEYVGKHLTSEYDVVMNRGRYKDRDCLYDAARRCIRKRMDDPKVIKRQIARYRKEGFPENFGRGGFLIFIRRHGVDEVQTFMREWFNEVLHGSSRDLLSFSYVLWKHPMRINFLDFQKTYNLFEQRATR